MFDVDNLYRRIISNKNTYSPYTWLGSCSVTCICNLTQTKGLVSDMGWSVSKNCLKCKYIFTLYMVMILFCCKQLNMNKIYFSEMAGSVFKVELFTLSNKLDGVESIWHLDTIFGDYKQVYYLVTSSLIAGCKQWYVFHKKSFLFQMSGTKQVTTKRYIHVLTHWGRDKMAAIFQTTVSNIFSWMKMYDFRLRFHWSFS